MQPYDADGRLNPDAIEALVRRVWWGECESYGDFRRARAADGEPLKAAPLQAYYPPARWPSWWPAQRWIDCGDRLDACTAAGWLYVRRRWR